MSRAIRALDIGRPPDGGLNVRIGRMVVPLTGTCSIQNVLLFPCMRPEA